MTLVCVAAPPYIPQVRDRRPVRGLSFTLKNSIYSTESAITALERPKFQLSKHDAQFAGYIPKCMVKELRHGTLK